MRRRPGAASVETLVRPMTDARPADAWQLPWHESPSIAPGRTTARDDKRLVRAMLRHLTRSRPNSDAEALRVLRRGFPETPLAVRVAVFAARLRQGREGNQSLTFRDKPV
jgi:hypothetical protein